MKNSTQTIIKYTIWAIIFSGLSIASAYAPWNEPDPNCVAPDCNPDAPINTGTSAQNKSGALGATQFCDSNGANCLSTTQIISTSSASQTKLGSLTTTGFSSLSDAYFATDISVGTPSDPTSLGLVGLFNGKVGATELCNASGAECMTPATGGTGGSVVYFKNSLSWYTKYVSVTSGTTIAFGDTMNWTVDELKSNIAEMADETRNIHGIIVNYLLTVNPPASGENMLYLFRTNDGPAVLTNQLFYIPDSSLGTGGPYGVIAILDNHSNSRAGNDDDTFRFTMSVERASRNNLVSGTVLGGSLRVIGYITE